MVTLDIQKSQFSNKIFYKQIRTNKKIAKPSEIAIIKFAESRMI